MAEIQRHTTKKKRENKTLQIYKDNEMKKHIKMGVFNDESLICVRV